VNRRNTVTVAMRTAAGLVTPPIEPSQPSEALRALVVPIAAGATCLAHVSDSGFGLVSRYLDPSVQDTLETWSALTTIVAVTGLGCALLLSLFVS
jgi:H+/gluconate symporter-like permease